MTSNEVIKALECCSNESLLKCNKCPVKNEAPKCMYNLSRTAAYHIKKQQEEIERLTTHNRIISKMLSEAWERIEGLDKLNETFKAEAIKKFVERLEEEMCFGNIGNYVMQKDIEEIAKETVGADNGQN